MHEEKSEGIVLKVNDFKDNARIITVFSLEHGLLQLLVKGVKSPERRALSTPLCRTEFLYLKGKTDLYQLKDGSILDIHLALRERLASLQIASEMAQALLKSQLPGKPAPQLYTLLSSCLKQLPLFEKPLILNCLFHLKLLQHEGVLDWSHNHFSSLSEKEWNFFKEIGLCKSFEKLKSLEVNLELVEKVKNLLYHTL